jgi:hypothetical protein
MFSIAAQFYQGSLPGMPLEVRMKYSWKLCPVSYPSFTDLFIVNSSWPLVLHLWCGRLQKHIPHNEEFTGNKNASSCTPGLPVPHPVFKPHHLAITSSHSQNFQGILACLLRCCVPYVYWLIGTFISYAGTSYMFPILFLLYLLLILNCQLPKFYRTENASMIINCKMRMHMQVILPYLGCPKIYIQRLHKILKTSVFIANIKIKVLSYQGPPEYKTGMLITT